MKNLNNQETFDAVIIGSGIGSLTTAAILADQGMKVIVLEKHHQLGGYTQGFQRKSWNWDVAVHYLSCMEPGDLFFHGCRYLTGNNLQWKKMPQVYDHFCFPDLQVDLPSSPEEFQDTLKSLFPGEHRAIERYFKDLKTFQNRLFLMWAPRIVSPSTGKMIKPVLKFFLRKIPEQSVESYFKKIGCSEKLKAVFCASWGTFGGLPYESSIYEHWLTPGSFVHGAWYPAGGVKQIPESLKNFTEERGGLVRTQAGVEKILLDSSNKMANGVILKSGEVIRGKAIISGTGIHATFTKFLPKENIPLDIKQVLKEYKNSVSYTQLFVGLNDDPSKIPGIDGSNYWISSTTSFPQSLKEIENNQELNNLDIKSVMLTFPSLKDPKAKSHTLTICAWINFDSFSRWEGSESRNRPDDYNAMKSRIKKALLKPVLHKFPQLSDLIEYSTLGTPLTAKNVTGHAQGSAYGLASPPGRYSDDRLHPKTAINGLFLTGSDIACSGVPGAFAGGVFCASVILNKNMATTLIKLDKKLYGSTALITENI